MNSFKGDIENTRKMFASANRSLMGTYETTYFKPPIRIKFKKSNPNTNKGAANLGSALRR